MSLRKVTVKGKALESRRNLRCLRKSKEVGLAGHEVKEATGTRSCGALCVEASVAETHRLQSTGSLWWHMGSPIPWHVRSSWTKDSTPDSPVRS